MNDLKEKFSDKIHLSKISDDPFDHLYIEDFFEEDLYKKILENIPDINDFQRIVDTGSVSQNYSPERYIFSIQSDDMNKISESQKEFWNEISKAFRSVEFWNAISSKFSKTLKERFENLTEEEGRIIGKKPTISSRTALIKDYTKYQLGAHTDSIRKIFSLLFYLPKNDDLKKIGTSLYRPIDIIDEKKLIAHFTREETALKFEKIKTCEFKKDSVFIFARTNYSFHGVEEVNINKAERNLFLVNFYGDKNTNG